MLVASRACLSDEVLILVVAVLLFGLVAGARATGAVWRIAAIVAVAVIIAERVRAFQRRSHTPRRPMLRVEQCAVWVRCDVRRVPV